MTENIPGPSGPVPLVSNVVKPVNLMRCLICQKIKDDKKIAKLTSTDDGRKVIADTSNILQDGLVTRIDENMRSGIKYHLSCYKTYKNKGERQIANQQKRKNEKEPDEEDSQLSLPVIRAKRSRVRLSSDPTEKPCIICNYVKYKGEIQRFRITTPGRAESLLKATRFNKDEVHTRMIFLTTIGDVFANDVMYHTNCFLRYITQFERDVEKLLSSDFENQEDTSITEKVFNEYINTLDVSVNGYALSKVRDDLNIMLKNQGNFDFKFCRILCRLFHFTFNYFPGNQFVPKEEQL